MVTPNNPVVVSEANLHMSMSVSAQDSSEANKEYGGDLTAEGKVGWGPFSLSAKLSAHVSVSSTQKRSSDYSSTTDATLTMVQGPCPEGLAKIVDALVETVDTALRINAQLSMLTAQKAVAELLPSGNPTPPPAKKK